MSECSKCDCKLLPFVYASYCPCCAESLEKSNELVKAITIEFNLYREFVMKNHQGHFENWKNTAGMMPEVLEK